MNSGPSYGCNLWRNAALSIVFLLIGLQNGLAAPGDLDPGFGLGGKAVTRFFNNGGIEINYPRAIALQPDGKMIVAGRAYSSQTGDDFALSRYNPDGSLDVSFGSNGLVRTDFFGLTDQAMGVAVLPDGKIIAGGFAVVGFNTNNQADAAFGLARYNPNGTLDATFGNGGKVVTNFFDSLDEAFAMVLQPDGKIVLAGFVTQGMDNGERYDFAVVRYHPNGSLDAMFGDGGKTFTDFAGRGDRAYWAALQPDGKIVLAGVAYGITTDADFALARYNTNGTLDSTFNGTGKITTDFFGGFEDYAQSVAIAPDGKIVAAGWARNNTIASGGQTDIAVARYNTNGTLDAAFDSDGKWTRDISETNDNEYGFAVTVQQNGKILVTGASQIFTVPTGGHRDFVTLRLNPSGDLDSSFGGGLVYTDFREFDDQELPTGDQAQAILLLPDGRIVVTGWIALVSNRIEWGIARYFGDPPGPTQTATPTGTPTATPAATPTATPTAIPTVTPTAPPSATPAITPTPTPTAAPSATPTATPTAIPARALNISTRLKVELGDQIMIGGFIITGNAPKNVVVRGIGPSLLTAGLNGVLIDPVLELRASNGTLIVRNDNWKDDQRSLIEGTPFQPTDDRESVIRATLQPAAYTVIMTGKNATTGVGLVEIYDDARATEAQLANISTRGFVQAGDNVMIGGFILGGNNADTRVAVRGIGPSLSQVGLSNLLADPTLELRNSNGAVLFSNDNWQDDPTQAAELTARALAPQDPHEAGIFASLPPGPYTTILTGKMGGIGLGLVEIYNLH